MGFMAISCVTVLAETSADHEVEYEYVEYLYDTDEEKWKSIWHYIVTSSGSPQISHIVFEFEEVCDPDLKNFIEGRGSVEDYEDVYDVVVSTGYDPKTGATGIKFEFEYKGEEGEEPEGWTANVWFTLWESWIVQEMDVWIKAGNEEPKEQTVTGSHCFEIPEVPFGSISVIITACVAMGILSRSRKNIITI